ncbi:protein of unknown function [Cupriavidus neocaledonicus]|uniref:Uncharacterized protein n=1 Tax=Cupriavidus neocaledonicus TaxID=1040979 RepID=A0A375H6H1_9BURK|nr:hypothetical protein CBM2605_A60437 [Cupriavidus neocaledonicus]SPD45770.1 protein of unknown function [Cupriavidus neocaledonicus]
MADMAISVTYGINGMTDTTRS